MTHFEDVERWIGRHAVGPDGHRIGKIADVYLDDASGLPEWLAVTTGLFGSRISFAPVAGARAQGDEVQVAHSKSVVKDSPNIEADGELSEAEEAQLYRHYGLEYSSPPTESDSSDTVEAVAPAVGAESGSASVHAEVSFASARRRLRRRDAAALDELDLEDAPDLGSTTT